MTLCSVIATLSALSLVTFSSASVVELKGLAEAAYRRMLGGEKVVADASKV